MQCNPNKYDQGNTVTALQSGSNDVQQDHNYSTWKVYSLGKKKTSQWERIQTQVHCSGEICISTHSGQQSMPGNETD